jgi:hypothetical protein
VSLPPFRALLGTPCTGMAFCSLARRRAIHTQSGCNRDAARLLRPRLPQYQARVAPGMRASRTAFASWVTRATPVPKSAMRFLSQIGRTKEASTASRTGLDCRHIYLKRSYMKQKKQPAPEIPKCECDCARCDQGEHCCKRPACGSPAWAEVLAKRGKPGRRGE